jgi:hypothetical protein
MHSIPVLQPVLKHLQPVPHAAKGLQQVVSRPEADHMERRRRRLVQHLRLPGGGRVRAEQGLKHLIKLINLIK